MKAGKVAPQHDRSGKTKQGIIAIEVKNKDVDESEFEITESK